MSFHQLLIDSVGERAHTVAKHTHSDIASGNESFQLPPSSFSSCRDILRDYSYPDAGKYVLVRFSSDPASRSHPVRYL